MIKKILLALAVFPIVCNADFATGYALGQVSAQSSSTNYSLLNKTPEFDYIYVCYAYHHKIKGGVWKYFCDAEPDKNKVIERYVAYGSDGYPETFIYYMRDKSD